MMQSHVSRLALPALLLVTSPFASASFGYCTAPRSFAVTDRTLGERAFGTFHIQHGQLFQASIRDEMKLGILQAAEGGIEVEAADETKQKKKQAEGAAPPPAVDVSKLDIRVGVIAKAWVHEEADKLFCEEIDIGEEAGPRSIASGLRAHYSVDDLVGQRVLVLANLKTRKLAGFPSHGMVLCAATDDGSTVKFVEPPAEAAVGERVMAEGYEGEPATPNQILKKKMLDKIFPDLKTNAEGVATYKGTPLSASGGPCVAQGEMANVSIS